MYSLDDTIAAISTPVGEGGIGIVRMSGPAALSISAALFRPALSGAVPSSPPVLVPYHLHYGHVLDPATGERVDEVLVAHMPAPRTYTRQDVVEINGHGGIVALRRILALCMRLGARLAEPGEFTARAFLNGRLDLSQAEAVLDVVRAKTDRSLQAAVGQLTGHLSGEVRSVRTTLIAALAYLEACIDFPEDEIPERDVRPDLEEASAGLARLLADADRGIVLRQGVRAAIVGRPNVGKSSLLNRLLRANRAIVTDIPGTTRDTLEETLNLQGVPVVLVDTAGIGALAQNAIEELGVERSRTALAQADLALLVVDASHPPAEADREIAVLVGSQLAIVVLNKIDLVANLPAGHLGAGGRSCLLDAPAVALSALTGEGMDRLEAAIVEPVLSGLVTPSAPVVTNPRHKEALSRALDHVVAALQAHGAGLAADLLAIDLAAAVHALGEITGQTASEDLVSAIFGSFCVGK
jgi:tRNA modification GTPase